MQRSSVLFTVLKVKGILAERLAPLGFTPTWHLFTSVIEPMNAGAVDIHADVADAVPIFTQSAKAPSPSTPASGGRPRPRRSSCPPIRRSVPSPT